MFKVAIIIFRETIEIALLLGTVFAATKNIMGARGQILTGVIIGILSSLLLAYFTSNISNAFDGFGQEIFNLSILITSVIIIGWTVIWMKGRARHLKQDLSLLSEQIIQGKTLSITLPIMVAIFIFREGSEIVLFVYSILAVEKVALTTLLPSILFGGGLGLMVGISLYLGLTQYLGRNLFKITSWLLILIAASLSTEIANLLNSLGLLTGLSNTLWDSSFLVDDASIVGNILNTLTGYQARPTSLQLLLYLTTITSILAIDSIYNKKRFTKT